MRGNHYYKRLGEAITSGRKRANLSQHDLAVLSDVDRSYLAEVEVGKANPSMRFLNRLSKILKIRVGILLKDL